MRVATYLHQQEGFSKALPLDLHVDENKSRDSKQDVGEHRLAQHSSAVILLAATARTPMCKGAQRYKANECNRTEVKCGSIVTGARMLAHTLHAYIDDCSHELLAIQVCINIG
jgi:hypothetical protein